MTGFRVFPGLWLRAPHNCPAAARSRCPSHCQGPTRPGVGLGRRCSPSSWTFGTISQSVTCALQRRDDEFLLLSKLCRRPGRLLSPVPLLSTRSLLGPVLVLQAPRSAQPTGHRGAVSLAHAIADGSLQPAAGARVGGTGARLNRREVHRIGAKEEMLGGWGGRRRGACLEGAGEFGLVN